MEDPKRRIAGTPAHAGGQRRLVAGGLVLGVGVGGLVDGIVLHQILQWHHLTSSIDPPASIEALRRNVFWDGVFHVDVSAVLSCEHRRSESVMTSMRVRWSRVPMVSVTAVLLLTATAATALAQAQEERLGGKVRADGEVIVPADETVPGHLYVIGGTIEIMGDVEGDLIATGGQIRVSGTVGGDALLAGGDITIDGDVGGSIRVAGGQVVVTGQSGEDLAVAAGRVRVAPAASVGADVLFSAGQARLDGVVEGNVLGITGDYTETGTVAGTTDVTVRTPEEPPTAAERVLDRVQRYLGLLLIGALLLGVAPRLSRRVAGHVRRRPLVDLGVGALALLAAVLGVVVIIGVGALLTAAFAALGLSGLAGLSITTALLLAALLAFAVVVISAFVAPVLVGLWLGGHVIDVDRGWLPAFGALALGTLALVVIFTIPYVGGLAALLVAMLGLGALVMLTLRRPREPDRVLAGPATPAPAG